MNKQVAPDGLVDRVSDCSGNPFGLAKDCNGKHGQPKRFSF